MSARILWIVFIGVVFCGVFQVSAQNVGIVDYGEPSCGVSHVPTFHTAGETPLLGNANFRLVSDNLVGGAPGLLWVTTQSANIPYLGLTVHVDPTQGFSQFLQADGQIGLAGDGTAIAPLRIPFVPFLVGGKVFAQGFFLDLGAPSALVATKGMEITMQLAAPPEIAAMNDRLFYQAYFTGVTPTLAGQLGRLIWFANYVKGFTYSRVDLFTTGGESHWMVIVTHDLTGMEFCLIPGGGFRMGDVTGTGSPEESPVRNVRIPPFLMARTEVPQAVWQAVMGSNPSNWQGLNLPVETIDFNDVQSFCARAELRLPSEAEWEHACRAGVNTCYYFGENAPPTNAGFYGWFVDNSGARSNPVGQKEPNAFGLFDMHGNVAEWVADPWHPDYNCAPVDGRVWTGTHSDRIVRGGSWSSAVLDIRSPARAGVDPTSRRPSLGFRPAFSMR